MSTIPLDVERRFERRWAARFSGALQEHSPEGQSLSRSPQPAKGREKPAGVTGEDQ
jgi:hypothetical protein